MYATRERAVFWIAGRSTRVVLVRIRVRVYAARELRFSGMIPSQRLKGRSSGIVLTLVRTDNDGFVSFSLCETH